MVTAIYYDDCLDSLHSRHESDTADEAEIFGEENDGEMIPNYNKPSPTQDNWNEMEIGASVEGIGNKDEKR